MKKLYTLALIMAFSLANMSIIKAQELMVNGGLEAWDDPNTPTSWDKAEDISQETAFVMNGTYSAGHTSQSSSKDLQQNVTGIVGGINYTISYYFLDNDTSAKTRIWSYWLEGDNYLDDNETELRPQEYSSNNPSWQQYTVTLTAPPTADGFRFEVRVYHENNFTGGKIYYDDFSVVQAGMSPEPTNYPADFTATGQGIKVNVDWTDDQSGAQLPNAYLILASSEDNIDLPVDGTPVANDPELADGSAALNIGYGVESCSFDNLDANTTYYFKIFPYTNGGSSIDYKTDETPPSASATTADVVIIETEDFNDGWGDWIRISVEGDLEWTIDEIHGVDGTPCAKCSGYDGQPYANEDWLISPPMNFDNYGQEVLTFFTADAYDGPALEVFISNDFDGSDPVTATWTPLSFETSSGFFEWISSGDIDVSGINGSMVYVGFKFTSTNAESATWEVDNVLITGSGVIGLGESNLSNLDVNLYPNPANNYVKVNTPLNQPLNMQIFNMLGKKALNEIQFTGEARIDLSSLEQGLYLIRFTDSDGKSTIKKLVIE